MSEILGIYHTAPNGDDLMKAMNDDSLKKPPQPKSAIIDPMNSMIQHGLRANPNGVPYATLRRMATVPAVSAIINTRLNQVARFARRPRFDGDLGFRIGLKDREKRMTDAQRKEAFEIEEFILNTGWKKNRVRKDNFNQFLRKIVRDSLEIDVLAFEKTPDRKNELAEIWAMDGATLELVVNQSIGEYDMELPVYVPETNRAMNQAGDIAYVQKINGITTAEYTEDEMAFAIRNPRTNIMVADFGLSELEILIEIVTGILNGVRYNTSYFSHSHLPQGVLELVGKYNDNTLEGFKRHWKTLTEGAPGKWSVPVMALSEGQGFKFTPFKNSNKDMEFNEFLDFLFNIACAVYQIDPNEVGFKSWSSSQGMIQSDNTREKMDKSKDKGFVPLMYFLSDTINSEVIDLINEEFVFEWVGVDEEDEDKKLNREKSLLESGRRTVNEIRKDNDEDEIDEDWANAPANPQLIQVYMADKNNAQALEQEGREAEKAKENEAKQAEQAQHAEEKEKENGEDAHNKQLEIMDRQHQHALEQNAQQQPGKDTDKIKKSIEDDFREQGIIIDWEDY